MLNQLPNWEKLAKVIIWKQIGELKDKTILDFGSGTGITADYFAADNQVTAIEPSEDMLAQQVNTNGYRQIIGSKDELKKLSSESFDYIFCRFSSLSRNSIVFCPERIIANGSGLRFILCAIIQSFS